MERRFTSFILGASIIAAGLLFGTAARASLIGDTVQGNFLNPTPVSAFSLGTAVVGSGIEFNFLDINIDFTASAVTFSAIPGIGLTLATLPFNGFGFVDVTHGFTGATVDASSTIAGFTASDLSVSGGELLVNLSGLTLSSLSNKFLTVDLSTASAVPEPGTLALFLGGLMGLIGVLRRRRKPMTA